YSFVIMFFLRSIVLFYRVSCLFSFCCSLCHTRLLTLLVSLAGFKDVQNFIEEKENQVHTRSLHAEENAFLQITKYGGEGIEGGILFTTASPCELCSKKAYQLGIKKVIYIDPYPGIANKHILKIGNNLKRPELQLFHGVIGNAYHKLYQPVLSFKDELNWITDIDLKYDNKYEAIKKENQDLKDKIQELEKKLNDRER
ncbi:MAG: hypothetical protein VKL42_13005, partial [Snowella sp.]|nr:hypothetical protein [Snowella sp.]